MPVTIVGNNTPTAGGVVYGDGTNYASTGAGTAGQPLVSGGSGAPTFRPYTLPAADGTANQLLRTNGAGALSFATVANPALVFIGSVTASNSATVSITSGINGTYSMYVLQLSSVVPSLASVRTLRMRFSTNGGSSYLSGATDYAWAVFRQNTEDPTPSGAGSSGAAYLELGDSTSTDLTNYGGLNGFVQLCNPSLAAATQLFGTVVEGRGSSTNWGQRLFFGAVKNTSAKNAIQFFFDAGNIASGTFRLYGIANS